MTEAEIKAAIEAASDASAKKVITELENHLFRSVGKTVIEKAFTIVGIGAIGIAFLWQNRFWPFH